MSECYNIEGSPPVIDMASYNGVDARIQLDHKTTLIGGSFSMSGEIFLRTDFTAWLLTTTTSVVGFTGFSNGLAHWRTNNGIISPPLPLNEWFNFRFEREWTVPSGNQYRVFVNDVQVALFGGPNFALEFDEMGARTSLTPDQWGDYDIRNFLLQRGSFASPITVLDMSMNGNACDAGPDSNNGTTFNMPLPSCP